MVVCSWTGIDFAHPATIDAARTATPASRSPRGPSTWSTRGSSGAWPVRDLEFTAALDQYLGKLQMDGLIEGWRLLRSKLGLGAASEFKVLIETRDLAQLDTAFTAVSTRDEPAEGLHHGVNSLVTRFRAALWRDFPDTQRVTGNERF